MTEDATAENSDTLRRDLKNVMTEIFHDGVVKAIDEAIRILTSLRKVESNFGISSSSSEVPQEFICPLSKKIMVEPVIIASGQTYEKRYITEWLKHQPTCPKSKQVLSHSLSTPNHLINDLITNWCQVNRFDRQIPSDEIVTELFTHDIHSLLQRISSSSSVADQIEAAKELRRQAKKFASVRVFFVSQFPDSITRLLSPLSALGEEIDSNPELQENLVTALFNISICEQNKTVIAENPVVIPLLTKSLKQGSVETRRNSAATLVSLSVIDSNRLIIGNSETIKALIDLIEEGDILATTEAASAVYNLCILLENREKAVSAGLIPVLTKKIRAGSNVDQLIAVLALVSTQNQGIEEMGKLGFIYDLFGILRNPSGSKTCENAVVIVFNMCDRNRDKSRLKVVGEEENEYGTFSKLVKQGSDRAVRKAQGILKWIKKLGAGKEPQRR